MTASMITLVPSDISMVKASELIISQPNIEYIARETIEFGHYLQEDTNGDGKVNKKDEKQPIKWQVISKNGNDLFLLADKALDCQPYNVENARVTWETCSVREWLNDTFLKTVFSESEKKESLQQQ